MHSATSNTGSYIVWSLCFGFLIGLASCDTTVAITTTTTTTTTTPAPTTPQPTFPPSVIPPETNLAYCLCNVRINECDVNCCCDPSCTASDRLAFSTCADQITPVNLRSCVQSSVIFINNTPDYTSTTSGSLFCVQTNNDNSADYFSIPGLIDTQESFNADLSLYAPPYSYQSNPSSSTIGSSATSSSYYKSGDPVLTLYDSSAILGTLVLPAPVNGQCLGSNPTAYLYPQDLQCSQLISSLSTSCSTNPWLAAKTYYQGFKVIATPAIFDAFNASDTSSMPSLLNSTELVQIVPASTHTCLSIDGIGSDCNLVEQPSLSGTTCTSTVVGVQYTIGYNGTDGITAVQVTFTYSNVTSVNQQTAIRLSQTFKTQFQQDNGTGLSNETTLRLSGNPGYIVGLPVMAGRLSSGDVNGVNQYVILVPGNNADWMTMVGGGACVDQSDSSNRLPVRFGVNMRSGCYVDLSYANMSQLCNQTQWTIWNALRGPNPPNYVATFGNSSVEVVGDWVPILNVDTAPLQSTAGSQPGQCNEQLIGLDIQIIYSNVGSRNTPQPRVIGASYAFQYQSTLTFQCYGPYCQGPNINSTLQRFNIWSSVSFIDASQPPVAAYGQIPQATARLPADFFYPFT